MFLRASDYPAVFRREEVFYIVHVFDLVSLFDFVQLPIESHKYALTEQDTVVILFEAHIVYTTTSTGKICQFGFISSFSSEAK